MKKIAVGIDFSPESTRAARQAIEIARHVGAEVVLVHARLFVELPPVGPDPSEQVRAALDTYRSRIARELDESRARLADLRTALAGQGPEVSQALVEGTTDEALGAAAHDLGADLLVVATHGRTGLRWLLLGSVARRVVRLAPVDVMVARGEAVGRGGFENVLVATDFSPSSLRALDRGVELASPRGRVLVVHCHQVPFFAGTGEPMVIGAGAVVDEAVEKELRARGEELLASRRRPGGPALEFDLLHDEPAIGIVHWLEARPHDLAVLGSHGRKGIRRAVLGSVAEAVAHRAPCSVLVARGAAG